MVDQWYRSIYFHHALYHLSADPSDHHTESGTRHQDAAGERINGTLTWTMMDLDPNYDLSFTDLELKDAKGEVVFKSPSLAIG